MQGLVRSPRTGGVAAARIQAAPASAIMNKRSRQILTLAVGSVATEALAIGAIAAEGVELTGRAVPAAQPPAIHAIAAEA